VPNQNRDAQGHVKGQAPDRWRTLFVVAISQLMLVLDGSIMNIAIPRAQADLMISDANRQWIITAYTLAFGSLLLHCLVTAGSCLFDRHLTCALLGSPRVHIWFTFGSLLVHLRFTFRSI
jgi:MFS family permease